MVFPGIEKNASDMLVYSGVQDQALMDLGTGVYPSSGLLPFQMPAGMKAVEQQSEDVPRDMACHTDANGN